MNLSEKRLQELKDKKISIEDLYEKYFYTQKDGVNVENILKLLNENICSFEEFVDKFKNIKDDWNHLCLKYLLENEEFFEKLIQNNKLNTEDLRGLLNKIGKWYELGSLNENTSLLRHIVDKGLFKELIDTFKSVERYNDPCLYGLLENKELFKELIQNNKLTTEDLKYLLDNIDKGYELRELCRNTQLIKRILNEFVLNTKLVDRFNTLIANNDWCKDHNIHTLFDCIEYEAKNNEEILNLNELNEKVYLLNSFKLNEDQRDELSEVLRNNEQAQSLLKQLVDNNLEDQYDFDTLKKILTKDSEKKKIKMNF